MRLEKSVFCVNRLLGTGMKKGLMERSNRYVSEEQKKLAENGGSILGGSAAFSCDCVWRGRGSSGTHQQDVNDDLGIGAAGSSHCAGTDYQRSIFISVYWNCDGMSVLQQF